MFVKKVKQSQCHIEMKTGRPTKRMEEEDAEEMMKTPSVKIYFYIF